MRISDWSSYVCSSDLVEPRHRLGERQCGLLAWGVVVDVAPDDETVEPFVGLSVGARLARVHLHAVRAAVDLRGAQDDQVVERAFETGRVDGGIDLAQGLAHVREQLWVADGVVVFHGGFPWIRRGALPVRRSGYRRSEEPQSELQSLMRISYAVFCL